MLNRRSFLKRFGIGVGAALTLASLPASAVKALTTEQAAKRCACEYLRKVYNDYMRGKSLNELPVAMAVSPGLFAAFSSELIAMERFTSADAPRSGRPSLMFKATPLFEDATVQGWDVRFTPAAPKGVEYAMNTTGAVYA